MTSKRWVVSWTLVLIVAAVVTALDQVTKHLVVESLGPSAGSDQISVVPELLTFRYVENTGAAFGLFRGSTSVLAVVSLGVVVFLALLFRGMISTSRLLGVAFGLQFGGAFGNLIDRLRLGYVVDFIDVPHWPTFNVADSGITVGVVILAFVLLIRPEWVAPAAEEVESHDPNLNVGVSGGTDDVARDMDSHRTISRDSGA